MSIDELYLKIKNRLKLLNTPVEHYLSIEYVIHQSLIDTLKFYHENGLYPPVLKKIADEGLPVTSEIRKKNVDLFNKITHYGMIHQGIKLEEEKRAEEKEIRYDRETVKETGALRVFTDKAKKVCFERYLEEINQYDALFHQIKKSTGNEEKGIDSSFGYVDLTGAQSILGFSKSKIYKGCSKLQIPHYKPGGKLMFKISELEEWIESGKQ